MGGIMEITIDFCSRIAIFREILDYISDRTFLNDDISILKWIDFYILCITEAETEINFILLYI